MKSNHQDTWLREILTGDELQNFREASMAKGLAMMRRKRRTRAALRVALAVCLPALLLSYPLIRRNPGPVTIARSPAPASPAGVQEAPRDEDIQPIGDDELLGLFKGQGVALIGKPGNQKLLVFGR